MARPRPTGGGHPRRRGPRVLIVVYSHYPWDPRPRRETEALQQAGYDCEVICCRDTGEPPRSIVAGVKVTRLPIRIQRGGALRYLWQYALFLTLATLAVASRTLEGKRIAFVHGHSLPDAVIFTGLPALLHGAKLILDLHEGMPEIFRARMGVRVGSITDRLVILQERLSTALADQVLVANPAIADRIVARGTPRHKVTVLPNTPETAGPDPIITEHLMGAWFPADTRRLVYLGGINDERDILNLVRATKTITARVGPVRLVLFGRIAPDFRPTLSHLLVEVGEDVSIHGGELPPDEVMSAHAVSEVGLITYRRNDLTPYTLPNKVFELLGLDLPILCPDLPALKSVLGENASYYDPDRPGDLAEVLSGLLGDEDQGAAGERSVDPRWTWTTTRSKLLGAYRNLRRGRGST